MRMLFIDNAYQRYLGGGTQKKKPAITYRLEKCDVPLHAELQKL